MNAEPKRHVTAFHYGQRIDENSNSFEWWYFDFDLESKHHLYLEWHAPNFAYLGKMCLLVFRCYRPNMNKPIIKVLRYPRSLISQGKNKCDIRIPSGYIVEHNGNYLIKIKEDDFSIDLKLERMFPPTIADEETIFRIEGNNEFFSWNIPLPKAKTSGKIVVDEEKIEASGIAYHDHNWGNLNIGKRLRGWTWVRVFFQDYTFIFGDITEKGSDVKTQVVILLDREGKKIKISSINVKYVNCLSCDHKLTVPSTIHLSNSTFGNFEINFKIENNLGLQEFPLASFDNHRINAILSNLYYVFKLEYAPKTIKRMFGQSYYFQFESICELLLEGNIICSNKGKMELFSFAN